MKLDFGAVFGQIITAFARLPFAQKIAIPVLFALSVATIVFVARWAQRPDYAVLFSGLEEADSAAVVEKLKDMKVGFRIREEGRTIDITPPEQVPELRLELASKGLPKGGSAGYELFNDNIMGRTGFVERIFKTRALQGELERTIGSLAAVKAVRIHITQPDKSMFVSRDVLPTASVMLKLKPGEQLTQQQILGISNLVSHSVERLTPENVTVVDSSGAILNEQRDLEGNTADGAKLDYRRKLESEYSRRIETMLSEVLGPGKAVARVTADLDFSKYEKEEESFDPGGQVTRSTRTIEEGSAQGSEGGVPGVISNLTNNPTSVTAPNANKDTSRRRENVANYEVSRAVSKTVSAVGSIKRVSVAVLVDGQYAAVTETAADGTTVTKKNYTPIAADMLKKIDNLVKQTVGYEPARGDIVSVENIRFFQPDDTFETALAQAQTTDMIWLGMQWGLPVIFTLLLVFVILRPLVKFLTSPTEAEVDLSRLLPAGIEELEAELEAERSKMSTSSVSLIEPSIDIEELEQLLAENSRIVKENPQQAALLIRYWLNDGRI